MVAMELCTIQREEIKMMHAGSLMPAGQEIKESQVVTRVSNTRILNVSVKTQERTVHNTLETSR